MKEYNRTHQIVVDYECLPCITVPATVGLYMLQYYEKMMNLFQVILGRTDIQRNSRHMTLWWLLMVFHNNTWTRAVIMKRLGLLVLNFAMRFSMLYQSKVTDPSWCTLKDALLCTTADCQSIQPKSCRSSQSDPKGYYSALKLCQSSSPSKTFLRARKMLRKSQPSSHQQYVERQDEHNRYIVSLNADILL